MFFTYEEEEEEEEEEEQISRVSGLFYIFKTISF
jgi:ribosomal protein L12E/L44/L45/RPP1/RPP2